MVFCGAYVSFSEVGAVVVGGDELNNTGRCGGAEERFDLSRGFIVGDEVSDGVSEVGEERKGGRESVDIGGSVFGWHGDDVGVTVVDGDEEVFHTASRLLWKSSSKVGSSPIFSGDKKSFCLLRTIFGRENLFRKIFCLFEKIFIR